jgi:hypothetical protein
MWLSSLVVGVCLALVPAAVAPAGASPARVISSPVMPWLSLSHGSGARAQIVDPQGRNVMLRGVNLVGLEDDIYLTADGQ